MTHLGERIMDYIFEELPPPEMAEARRHLSECPDCAARVEQIRRTNAMLMAAPDVEPPRSILFEFPKPSRNRGGNVPAWNLWKWLAPLAAAAVIVIAVAIASPIRIQWQDSQLTIAFRGAAIAEKAQVPVDYARIEALIEELKRRDALHTEDAQSIGGRLAYLEGSQQRVESELLHILSRPSSPTPKSGD